MTTSSPSAIEALNLGKQFITSSGPLSLFSELNLRVAAGESVAIVGPSGAGKSTLLSLLAGLDTPNQGQIRLLGQDLTQLSDQQSAAWRARHLSFIFQSFHLLPELTALENVRLPLDIQADPAAADKARALLDQVGLGQRHQHYPGQLSGGEQQRVAIARAFVSEPAILFADEPTGNLDSDTGAHIIDQLFSLNQQTRTTLVLITHDSSLANRCQRQLRLTHGQLEELTPPC